jgi:hypothetical protein
MTRPTPDRVPEILVEQLALGELDPTRARAVEARLAAEPGGAERLAALRADDARTLAAHPPERISVAIEARARVAAAARAAPRPRRSWILPSLSALAAAALVVVIVRPGAGPEVPRPHLPGDGADVLGSTRAKGPTDPRLTVFLEHDDGAERLVPGAAVAPRDRLQLGYVANGAAHGVLLSIDGRGAVTLHYPEADGGDTALASDGEAVLPYAYELDDAPDFERFLLVTSDRPLAASDVVSAARRLAAQPGAGRTGDLTLPGARVTSLLLRKVVPR